MSEQAVVRAKVRLREALEILARAHGTHEQAADEILSWAVGACVGVGMRTEVISTIVAQAEAAALEALAERVS